LSIDFTGNENAGPVHDSRDEKLAGCDPGAEIQKGWTRGSQTMKTEQWADTLLELARADIQSPAYKDYYAITLTRERAGIYLGQLALFIPHRRDCWSYVSGNCPVMSVKRKILEHEYEEVIEDEYSKYGHLDLVVRQAEHIGMSAGEVLDAPPLPMTSAVLYSWG